MDEILVLSNEPLPETETTITLNILSAEGGATRGTRLIQKKELEGKITFDRCQIFSLPTSPGSTSLRATTAGETQWDLYLIIIPFTLHKAPGDL